MTGDAFEWDDSKAEENYAKHGVDFELAQEVFRDPLGSSGSMTGKTTARSGLSTPG
jgi:uncharacterized DUF497 family protein